MILRFMFTTALLVFIGGAKAAEFDETPSYVCGVSYEPFTGQMASGGTAGKHGYIMVRFDKEPECTWSAHDRFAYYCSKGATSAICAKATGQHESFALQMLHSAFLKALSEKTMVFNSLGDCISGTQKCVYSSFFYHTPQ